MSTPELLAREKIDAMLSDAGWAVQDKKHLNPSAALGVAVREYDTDAGPADYILFVDRVPVGVIEAKKPEEAEKFAVHESQPETYAASRSRMPRIWMKRSCTQRSVRSRRGSMSARVSNFRRTPEGSRRI
jgi:type I site-specific restriction endonuclease